MKWMLVRTNHSEYVSCFIEAIQKQYAMAIVDANKDSLAQGNLSNTIVSVDANNKKGFVTRISQKMRYNALVKKWNVDRIILTDPLVQLNTQLPQLLILNNNGISFSEKEKAFILKNKCSFITYSSEIKDKIVSLFPNYNCALFNPVVDNVFQPKSWEQSLEIKEKYAEGNDYFLLNSLGQDVNYTITILKGFSIFKKWQNSAMKIIILTDDINALQDAVANYKYREDVSIVNQPGVEEKAALLGAAYTAIHLTADDSDNLFALQSAKTHTPLLLRKNCIVFQWFNEQAFCIEEFSSDILGQAFITMYKAENIRAKYIDFLSNNELLAPNDDWENIVLN